MSGLERRPPGNRILAGLTPADRSLLDPHLEPVPLNMRDVIAAAGESMGHVHFVEQGITSLLADTSEGRIEVGMIGPEGLVGLPVVFGVDRTPHTCMVQAEGRALRMTSSDLRAAMDQSRSLKDRLFRYAHTFMVQTTQTAYANATFTIEARLARWILMTQDRLGEVELPLTHEFLAMMLGVRRPGVTVAVQILEGNGLIRARRGRITVLDRARLEELADDSYGLPEAEYASVLGQA